MNTILTAQSNSGKNYKIAKIKDKLETHDYFGTSNNQYTNVNLNPQKFSLDPHPNSNGHSEIKNAILPYLENVQAKTTTSTPSNNNQDSNQSDNGNSGQSNQIQVIKGQDEQDEVDQDEVNQDEDEQDEVDQDEVNQDEDKQDEDTEKSATNLQNSTNQISNKSNSNNSQTNSSTTTQDSSVAQGKLPQTGVASVFLALFIVSIIGIFSFIMYKKYKNIV